MGTYEHDTERLFNSRHFQRSWYIQFSVMSTLPWRNLGAEYLLQLHFDERQRLGSIESARSLRILKHADDLFGINRMYMVSTLKI